MYSLIFELSVEKSFVEALHEGVDGLIGILEAADEKLPLPNACLLDGRVVLDVSDGKVSVEYFIKPLFSQR